MIIVLSLLLASAEPVAVDDDRVARFAAAGAGAGAVLGAIAGLTAGELISYVLSEGGDPIAQDPLVVLVAPTLAFAVTGALLCGTVGGLIGFIATPPAEPSDPPPPL